jgi:hypothetical protein
MWIRIPPRLQLFYLKMKETKCQDMIFVNAEKEKGQNLIGSPII